jgi:hypothetical protein
MASYRVSRQDLARGTKEEMKEHPWASPARARRIARDHLREKGPAAYRDEKFVEKVDENINKKMGAKPHPKKRIPRPYDPMTDGLPKTVTRLPY